MVILVQEPTERVLDQSLYGGYFLHRNANPYGNGMAIFTTSGAIARKFQTPTCQELQQLGGCAYNTVAMVAHIHCKDATLPRHKIHTPSQHIKAVDDVVFQRFPLHSQVFQFILNGCSATDTWIRGEVSPQRLQTFVLHFHCF